MRILNISENILRTLTILKSATNNKTYPTADLFKMNVCNLQRRNLKSYCHCQKFFLVPDKLFKVQNFVDQSELLTALFLTCMSCCTLKQLIEKSNTFQKFHYRDRVRTSSNVLSSTMCAYITNHLTRSDLKKLDQKARESNDITLATKNYTNDNVYEQNITKI